MGMVQQQDKPIGDLVKDLSEQTSALVRQEVELAKVELTEKGKRAGLGAGMFGGAGLLGFYAFGAFTACLILAIATALPAWAAALIVTVLYGAGAGLLALRGKTKVQEATPPVPEQAVDSAKRDVRYTKARVEEARR